MMIPPVEHGSGPYRTGSANAALSKSRDGDRKLCERHLAPEQNVGEVVEHG
jgi:hypothetical protein